VRGLNCKQTLVIILMISTFCAATLCFAKAAQHKKTPSTSHVKIVKTAKKKNHQRASSLHKQQRHAVAKHVKKVASHTLVSSYVAKNQHKPSLELVTSIGHNLVDFVQKTVSTVSYSAYKLGGSYFDIARGVYIVDCSRYVDRLLKLVNPKAYSSLVSYTGADTPTSQHYYDFFIGLEEDPSHFWRVVDNVEKLQPGDILVFRYKNHRGGVTGGHVMIVMSKPLRDKNTFLVRIADSAPTRHSQDTRQSHDSGIGIGSLLLKANPITGQPSAYAWGIDSYWNYHVDVAMARPVDV